MKSLLIEDGYTFEAEIKPEGIRPGVIFRFRPATTAEVAAYQERAGREPLDAMVQLLASHLVAWDVVDAAGKAALFNAATLRKVPMPVLIRMSDKVTGYDPNSQEADEKNSGTAGG